MSMKNSNDTIGNRDRDIPACSAVPQPTAPQRSPPPSQYEQIMEPWGRSQEKLGWKTEESWFYSGKGNKFWKCPHWLWGPLRHLLIGYLGHFPYRSRSQSIHLTIQLHLVPRMRAPITPILFMPSWLAQEQLYYQHILELSAIKRI